MFFPLCRKEILFVLPYLSQTKNRFIRFEMTFSPLTHCNRPRHKRVNVAMVAKCTNRRKGETKRATRENCATIKCRSIVACGCMGYLRRILPRHDSANRDRQRLRTESQGPRAIHYNLHHRCRCRLLLDRTKQTVLLMITTSREKEVLKRNNCDCSNSHVRDIRD